MSHRRGINKFDRPHRLVDPWTYMDRPPRTERNDVTRKVDVQPTGSPVAGMLANVARVHPQFDLK